jgi:acetyl esterase/lipase
MTSSQDLLGSIQVTASRRSLQPLIVADNLCGLRLGAILSIGRGLDFFAGSRLAAPVAESDTIVAAMQARNIPVTYVVYPDEGHGFAKPPNRLSYITIAEAFFARHLGGEFEPVGRDLEGSSHEIRAGDDILRDLGVI